MWGEGAAGRTMVALHEKDVRNIFGPSWSQFPCLQNGCLSLVHLTTCHCSLRGFNDTQTSVSDTEDSDSVASVGGPAAGQGPGPRGETSAAETSTLQRWGKEGDTEPGRRASRGPRPTSLGPPCFPVMYSALGEDLREGDHLTCCPDRSPWRQTGCCDHVAGQWYKLGHSQTTQDM